MSRNKTNRTAESKLELPVYKKTSYDSEYFIFREFENEPGVFGVFSKWNATYRIAQLDGETGEYRFNDFTISFRPLFLQDLATAALRIQKQYES